MFFDEEFSDQIGKYGIALLTGKGKCHFVASIPEMDGIKLLCQSNCLESKSLSLNKSVWFEDEVRAAKKFRKNKHACQKCLRAIETILYELDRAENFA